ncbi:hypothetical protein AAIB33_13095 [Microbacterium sp. AZCO]|uniref:hypothetical protein n=1 Tax=Microbacterium sp. AZCO TaxID=3142976 RepID=UPI0031F3DD2D
MTTHAAAAEQSPLVRRRGRIGRGTVLIVGVVLIPWALALAFNNYGPLTVDGAIQMAFATVAGQTVAIISAVTAFVLTVRRRYAWPAVVALGIIAALITFSAFSMMASAGDTLVDRLGAVAEADQLNS